LRKTLWGITADCRFAFKASAHTRVSVASLLTIATLREITRMVNMFVDWDRDSLIVESLINNQKHKPESNQRSQSQDYGDYGF
jgi:hypothetical protein